MSLELFDLDAVIGDYSGLSRTVLEYSKVMKQLVDEAKQPGFSTESWAPLAALVNVGEFERVGAFKEVQGWADYVEFLTAWATGSDWECSFKRVTEIGNLVLLELEERMPMGDTVNAVNSASVYEFDDAGKLTRLYIYLQMELSPEMFGL